MQMLSIDVSRQGLSFQTQKAFPRGKGCFSPPFTKGLPTFLFGHLKDALST